MMINETIFYSRGHHLSSLIPWVPNDLVIISMLVVCVLWLCVRNLQGKHVQARLDYTLLIFVGRFLNIFSLYQCRFSAIFFSVYGSFLWHYIPECLYLGIVFSVCGSFRGHIVSVPFLGHVFHCRGRFLAISLGRSLRIFFSV